MKSYLRIIFEYEPYTLRNKKAGAEKDHGENFVNFMNFWPSLFA